MEFSSIFLISHDLMGFFLNVLILSIKTWKSIVKVYDFLVKDFMA